MLSASRCQRFVDEGYLVLPRAFDADTLDSLRRAIDETVHSLDPEKHRRVFRTTDRDVGRDELFYQSAETVEYFLEDGAANGASERRRPFEQSINKLGHALHDHVPAIASFCRHRIIGRLLRDLGQARPQLWQSMVIFKQPGIGGEVRWHQDATYLHTEPPGVIGFWLALEDATVDNGCLLVSPGAHRGPLRERYRVDWAHRTGHLHTIDTTPWPPDEAAVALEIPAGSAVVFSDHLPHASAANTSARSRLALTLHFADSVAQWSPDNWLQRPNLPPFRV